MSLPRRADSTSGENSVQLEQLVPIASPPRRIVQFNYEWRIGNYRRGAMKEELLRSQPFSSKDPQRCKWMLELFPHGSPDVYNQGYASVFLILKECRPEDHIVSATVQFGIRKFGPEIKDVYFEASEVDFEKDRRFGLVRFMTQSEIFSKENNFLHHDSMTVLCDVKILNALDVPGGSTPPPPLQHNSTLKRTSSFGNAKNFFLRSSQRRTAEERPILHSDAGSQVRSDSSSVTYETRSTAPPLPAVPHRESAHRESATGSYSPVQGLSRTIEIPKDTLLEDMVALLNSGRFSDVTLDVGKREFNVHKAILAARSAVFDTMFSSNLTSNHYAITDVTSRAMKELLYFIYTGRTDKTPGIVEEVLEAAQKYKVVQLQAMCETLVLRDLQVDNAVKTLILAHEHKAQQLKEIVLEFIARNFQAVKRTEGWNILRTSHTDLYADIIDYM